MTYACGRNIEIVHQNEWGGVKRALLYKKWCVGISVVLNLSVLFFFKYFGFVAESINKLFLKLNICMNIPIFDVLLPVGISFYTFQALSYTMDVYRGEIHAEKSFLKYALFVSFFPQLVAGPIERSKNLLTQLSSPSKLTIDKAKESLLLMLWGFFLKIVIADRIAIFVDTVYESPETYGGWYAIVATVFFAFQIYCDFYGYSVIAMGTAKMLGIQLIENFNAPYLSQSITEFWRRWHISLNTWFRDYLYFPLGGNRKGKIRKYFNKMFVFCISGLWHGASWNYLIWGGINGIYQIVGEALEPVRERLIDVCRLDRRTFSHRFLNCIITFVLVDFSWIFFRADGFYNALNIIKSMVRVHNWQILFDGSLYECGLNEHEFRLMFLSIVVLMIADIAKKYSIEIRYVIIKQEWWFQCVAIALAICGILLFGIWGYAYSESSFIYFQF